jgi:predicted nucleic acid-binding protein
MKYVYDSSAAVKTVLPEADSDKANDVVDQFRRGLHELLAPEVFPLEAANSLTRAARRGRITGPQAWGGWLAIMADSPLLLPSLPLMPRAIDLSLKERIGVYDCVYVALAEREGCELVTADDKLLKNLGPRFPFIIPLSSL